MVRQVIIIVTGNVFMDVFMIDHGPIVKCRENGSWCGKFVGITLVNAN